MLIRPVDRAFHEEEWRSFLATQRLGHLVATARGDGYPTVAPTQFVLDGRQVLCHFAAANPIVHALESQSRAVMSVAGDWAFIPSSWKVVGEEDPLLGIPTTYYGSVQLRGTAHVLRDPAAVAEVLRRQLRDLQPSVPVADPFVAHGERLKAIRAVVLEVDEVDAKFKYGGNVDTEHAMAVIGHLTERAGPGDLAAASQAARRLRGAGSSADA